MIHAYDEMYLSHARAALGSMLQFAVYDLKIDIVKFYTMFLNSGIAKCFAYGEPKYTVGMSGVELAYEVIYKTTGQYCNVKPEFRPGKSPEYWCGWALAYFAWEKNISFEVINESIRIDEIVEMYNPYHEADINKFVSVLESRMQAKSEESKLARLRAYAGLTQKALAERSGVSVRMIEQYEQGKKSLNKASAETVLSLSRTLHCEVADLIQ
ncbi:MAG: helix-turn-helix transcriptional regulator [Lachnospiraceae bacterium]|nr:helix-turn-helix transcriptional regulator [Lachnospiraceae bacterium]